RSWSIRRDLENEAATKSRRAREIWSGRCPLPLTTDRLYPMLPELFRIPGLNIPIYSYGLMLVVGFLLAAALAKFLARRAGLNPEVFINAGIIALIAGVVGARLSHVLENWSVYTDASRSVWENLKDAADIRSGGLTFYGGF